MSHDSGTPKNILDLKHTGTFREYQYSLDMSCRAAVTSPDALDRRAERGPNLERIDGSELGFIIS